MFISGKEKQKTKNTRGDQCTSAKLAGPSGICHLQASAKSI